MAFATDGVYNGWRLQRMMAAVTTDGSYRGWRLQRTAFTTDGGWVLCPGVADARAAISVTVLCYGAALAIVLPSHSITVLCHGTALGIWHCITVLC